MMMVAGYIFVALVWGCVVVVGAHRYAAREWPLSTTDHPDVADYALGVFEGLLWPGSIPVVLFALLLRFIVRRSA